MRRQKINNNEKLQRKKQTKMLRSECVWTALRRANMVNISHVSNLIEQLQKPNHHDMKN